MKLIKERVKSSKQRGTVYKHANDEQCAVVCRPKQIRNMRFHQIMQISFQTVFRAWALLAFNRCRLYIISAKRKLCAMDNEAAINYLSSLLGKTLRIQVTPADGRIFVGQMKCTDKVRPVETVCF